ncbi:MAG TPA: hypothetical protein VKB49_08745 [Candidatus Sulfotelmatobacter sp.]|nr:hypothetical protein [Candidatus Sulfotelmatobacter sp.]
MAPIRRLLIGTLGVGLTIVGLDLFLAIYAPDLYAVPLAPWKQGMLLILCVAVGAAGIWLVRFSLRRR